VVSSWKLLSKLSPVQTTFWLVKDVNLLLSLDKYSVLLSVLYSLFFRYCNIFQNICISVLIVFSVADKKLEHFLENISIDVGLEIELKFYHILHRCYHIAWQPPCMYNLNIEILTKKIYLKKSKAILFKIMSLNGRSNKRKLC